VRKASNMLTFERKKRKLRNRLERMKIRPKEKDRRRLENRGNRKEERSSGLKCYMRRLSKITERELKIIWLMLKNIAANLKIR